MSWPEIVGLITGILTIVGVVVALTRYVTQLQLQVRLERSETQKSQAEEARADLMAANKLLLEELAVTRRTGGAASAKKAEIDDELRTLMTLLSAEAGSVYLPLPEDSRKEVSGLVFLAIEPVTEHTMKLRKKIIPLHSLAGRCFTKTRSLAVTNAKSSHDHYDKADQLSGYRTEDTLSIPLRTGVKVVGVLQLLNKKGGDKFSEQDIEKTQELSKKIAAKVEEFSLLPGSLELLGVVPQTNTQYATIMFCDLTASSVLFQELNVSAAVQHINEYLEEMCNVAFRCGATVDKYMGDGVLFRFNVPHPVDDHPVAAVQAALDMQTAFDAIKKDWLTMGEVVGRLYTRSGLAYGPVQKATVGHPQYQYLTVFGRAVNAAVNLCENAARNRNVVVIDQLLYEEISNRFRVSQTPVSDLGKALNYTSSAYEVSGLSERT
jgi:class 3 adenylate cyclase